MKKDANNSRQAHRFSSLLQSEVPHSRNGKHHDVVGRILKEVQELSDGRALKVPLEELLDTKEKLRSALSRAGRKKNLSLATAADERFLYIWLKDRDEDAAAD